MPRLSNLNEQIMDLGFPEELRKALGAISNPEREELLLTLMQGENLSYTELLRQSNMRKGSLTHHLKNLIKAGLVRNYSLEFVRGPYDSFYAATDFGKRMVQGIFSAVEPEVTWVTTPPALGAGKFATTTVWKASEEFARGTYFLVGANTILTSVSPTGERAEDQTAEAVVAPIITR